MARSKTKGKSRTTSGSRGAARTGTRSRAAGGMRRQDAIAVLKADHREVAGWFTEFEKSRAEKRKLELAGQICTALTVHAAIEEEIFYPAYLEATGDRKLHHEAAVEHEGVKRLIAQIESTGADDEFYDARMKVLSEMVKHHVKEEEGSIFPEARSADMDLKSLGEALLDRKGQLMSESTARRPRARRGDRIVPLHA